MREADHRDREEARAAAGIGSGTPTQVKGITGLLALTAGSYFACAIHGASNVSCWGRNDEGQLGTGATSVSEVTPVLVPITKCAAIDAGGASACCGATTSLVRCWGNSDPGDGKGQRVLVSPLGVPGITDAVDVATFGAGGEFGTPRIVGWRKNPRRVEHFGHPARSAELTACDLGSHSRQTRRQRRRPLSPQHCTQRRHSQPGQSRYCQRADGCPCRLLAKCAQFVSAGAITAAIAPIRQ